MNRYLVPVSAAGLGVVLLAGCGGPSAGTPSAASASRTSSSSSPVASPSASSPAPASPPSRAQLEDILLQPEDFPAGSIGNPRNHTNAVVSDAEKALCVGVPNPDAALYTNAKSYDFSFPDESPIVLSTAKSYASQGSVDEFVAMVRSPKFSHCYEQFMRQGIGADGSLEELSVKITPGSAGGPANVVATGTSTIKMKGQPAISLSLAFISGPLTTAHVIANGMDGEPVPAADMGPLVAAVANRAAKG